MYELFLPSARPREPTAPPSSRSIAHLPNRRRSPTHARTRDEAVRGEWEELPHLPKALAALFYFLQLYTKRNRTPQPPGSPGAASAAAGVANPPTASPIHRSLSPLAVLPALSARGAVVRTGDEDSLYYAGLRRCADDPYHPVSNPTGLIGIAENHMSLELVGRWIEEHAEQATLEALACSPEDDEMASPPPANARGADSDQFLVEANGSTRTLILNRPRQLNALSSEMGCMQGRFVKSSTNVRANGNCSQICL